MKLMPAMLLAVTGASVSFGVTANTVTPLEYDDIFLYEYASNPLPHPDGDQVAFVRNWMDRKSDRRRTGLWIMDVDGSNLQPLTPKEHNVSNATWSPDGERLAYTSDGQIHMVWLDSGRTVELTNFDQSPGSLSWSPSGEYLAFSKFVPERRSAPVSLPGQPDGAEWAEPPQYIDDMYYRADGRGFLPQGSRHIFVMPADGGAPRQLTEGDWNHGGNLEWTPDGDALIFAANRTEDPDRNPIASDIFRVELGSREVTQLTERDGPSRGPRVSPDGSQIAFTGFTDRKLAHQGNRLYVMNSDGSGVENLTEDLDRSIGSIQWAPDGAGIYVQYDHHGDTRLALQSLDGDHVVLADDLGGTYYSRPYTSGQFNVGDSGLVTYIAGGAERGGELAVIHGGQSQRLTHLSDALLAKRDIGQVEEFWYESSVDGKDIQGWVIYPPGFDQDKEYPLILEIHGGPHTAYGPQLAFELQLMAAKGYVVVYTNPRGSTSYGEDFANEIHHNYPSYDYNDLMDGVDAIIERGFINEDEMFVMGGSGGGVLTTWTIGQTDRFAAAMAVNPVINWYSFVLTADRYNYFAEYWMPALPWEDPEHYLNYSPISLVGEVETPTMLFTGTADYRTPMSETEQYYQALQLRGVDTALVRVPDAPHALHLRPSNLMAKPAYAIYWFEKYRKTSD